MPNYLIYKYTYALFFFFLVGIISCHLSTNNGNIQQTAININQNQENEPQTTITEQTETQTDTCYGMTWQNALNFDNWYQDTTEFSPRAIYDLFKQKNKTIEANKHLKKQLHLPKTTILYEYEPLTKAGFANRAIAVLLTDACLDVNVLHSCFVSQIGFVTIDKTVEFALIDTDSKKILNTIPLGEYGQIPVVAYNQHIFKTLDLQDYAHDGKACEFYVPSYICCGNTDYQFIGYNPLTDKLQIIKFKTTTTEQKYDEKTETYLATDTSYVEDFEELSNAPLDKMKKSATLKYSYYYGHGDERTNFIDIKFDAKKFCFTGTLIRKLNNKETKSWTGH